MYEFRPLADVPDYRLKPRGRTALLDAIGKTLTRMRDQFDAMPEGEVPGSVSVVILIYGEENESKERRSRRKIRRLIADLEKKGWTFVLLGADQDAFAAAGGIGISADTTLS